jgi:hypothetical protein
MPVDRIVHSIKQIQMSTTFSREMDSRARLYPLEKSPCIRYGWPIFHS